MHTSKHSSKRSHGGSCLFAATVSLPARASTADSVILKEQSDWYVWAWRRKKLRKTSFSDHSPSLLPHYRPGRSTITVPLRKGFTTYLSSRTGPMTCCNWWTRGGTGRWWAQPLPCGLLCDACPHTLGARIASTCAGPATPGIQFTAVCQALLVHPSSHALLPRDAAPLQESLLRRWTKPHAGDTSSASPEGALDGRPRAQTPTARPWCTTPPVALAGVHRRDSLANH